MAQALVNARVLTMQRPDTEAEAVLWDDGRIVLVGRTSAVTAEAKRRGASIEDADGRIVLPGFVDAHTHFLHVGIKRNRPDLREAADLEQALERVARWVQGPGASSRSPVIAEGWDESSWPGRARPTRDDLDRLMQRMGQPDRPLVLRRICGHVAVASTAALGPVRARWDDDSLVDRESGVLLEQPSLYLNEVFPAPEAELDAAIRTACAEAHRLGVTAVGDYAQAPYRAALLRAAASGALTVRVASSIYVQQLEAELSTGFRTGRRAPGDGGAWLRDGGLKVFLDGSLGARTAALRARYLDAPPGTPHDCPEPRSRHGCVGHPHVRGTLNWSDDDVRRMFDQAHATKVQVHAHAIGDAAIDQGLEQFTRLLAREMGLAEGKEDLERSEGAREEAAGPRPAAGAMTADGNGRTPARAASGTSDPDEVAALEAACLLRHRFEHFEIAHDEQVAACARLGLVASSQPNFVGTWSTKGGMYEERLGPDFFLNNRFQTMRRMGLALAFGSDGMPMGPLLGIEAALRHPLEDERLRPEEAIWHYTHAAAWSLHWQDAIGTLEVGKLADLVLLGTRDLDGAAQDWGIGQVWTHGMPRLPAAGAS